MPSVASTAASDPAALDGAEWRSAYDRLPSGFGTPVGDRAIVDRASARGASAYGEITPESAGRLLRWLRLDAGDVLCDLGSGTGRLVLQAACTTRVGRAIGIELSSHRHAIAERAHERLLGSLTENAAAGLAGRVELRRGNLLDADFGDATVIYAGLTCLPPAALAAVARRAARASRLRYLIATCPLPRLAGCGLVEIGGVDLVMSWADRVRVRVHAPIRR